MVKYKYTPEQLRFLESSYTAGKPLADIALEMNKLYGQEWSVRSLRGKLISIGLYEKPGYLNKLGQKPQSKEQLVEIIANKLDRPVELVDSLTKANKSVLYWLIEKL